MKKPFETLFIRWIYLLCSITFGLYFYSLFRRPVHVDTAILGEPVYWLAKEGVLRSELQRGWFHAEEHFFFTHKLFLYIGAAWTNLLGWSANILDSLSLVYFALMIFAWWKISQEKSQAWKFSSSYFVLLLLLLVSNHHIYELSFVFRPEIALACIAGWIFFFLNRFIKTENIFDFLIAACLGAAGIGHHLNGVIFVSAGFLLLMFYQKYIPALGYGLLGALGFAFYLIDIRSLSDFNLMIAQLFNMQDIRSEHTTWVHYVLNIPKEQSRFFHSPVEIGFTLLVFSVIILNFRQLWKEYRSLIVFTASASLTLALISHDKDTKYLALNMPAFSFLAVAAIRHLFLLNTPGEARSWIPRRLVPVLLVLFLIGQWRSNSNITFNTPLGPERFEQLAKDLPDSLKVLGPTAAVFWAIPHHHRFQSPIVYKILDSHDMFFLDKRHLEEALVQNPIDAVIIDKEFLRTFKMDEPSLQGFSVFSQDVEQSLFLLRRNSTSSH